MLLRINENEDKEDQTDPHNHQNGDERDLQTVHFIVPDTGVFSRIVLVVDGEIVLYSSPWTSKPTIYPNDSLLRLFDLLTLGSKRILTVDQTRHLSTITALENPYDMSTYLLFMSLLQCSTYCCMT